MPVSPEPNREIGASGAPLLVQMGGSYKGVFLYPECVAVARKPLHQQPAVWPCRSQETKEQDWRDRETWIPGSGHQCPQQDPLGS